MSSAFSNDSCIICKAPESDDDKLRTLSAGLHMIVEYSDIFQLNEIQHHLQEASKKDASHIAVKIHVSCQKRIGNEIRKKKRQDDEKVAGGSSCKMMKRRSDELDPFNWKVHCLFCGKTAMDDEKKKHPDRQTSLFSCAESTDLKNVC